MCRAAQFLAAPCALLLVATQVAAGDAAPPSRSPYRLRTDGAETFLLKGAPTERYAAKRVAARPYAVQIRIAARKAFLDPALVHAVVAIESGYDAGARSPKGALGLMQVMPQTALRYGEPDPTRSVEVNLAVGTRYLRDLLRMFGGRLDLALAAYNAGEQAVLDHGRRVPPYPETRRYVTAVSNIYHAAHGRAAATAGAGREYMHGTRLAR